MTQKQEPCPYCGETCDADWVDVGVGYVQCGPYYCENCHASQIGPHDAERDLSDDEKRTGWYAPGEPPSNLANTCGGELVNHDFAKWLYDRGLLDEKEGLP